MIPQEKINLIREKCIVANRDITKLEFGCEVVAESSLVKNSYWHAVLIAPNMGIGHWTCRAWQDAFPNIEKLQTFKEKNFKQILGRPIRLADVIHTIMCNHETDNINLFADIGEIEFDDIWRKKTAKWNLLKDDLRLQSEETRSFLAGLLADKKK